jgi:hypothetical protein
MPIPVGRHVRYHVYLAFMQASKPAAKLLTLEVWLVLEESMCMYSNVYIYFFQGQWNTVIEWDTG